MAPSISPSMILSHYSTRTLRLSFTKSINLRNRSLYLSISHPPSITFSFTVNGSVSQSLNGPFTLFSANYSPIIHEIDPSTKSITLSFTQSTNPRNLPLCLSRSIDRSSQSLSIHAPFTFFSTLLWQLRLTSSIEPIRCPIWNHRDNSAKSSCIACDHRSLHMKELDLSSSMFIDFARFQAQHSIIHSDDHLSIAQLNLEPGLQ